MVKDGAGVLVQVLQQLDAVIGVGAQVGTPPEADGTPDDWGIAVVAEGIKVGDNAVVPAKAMVTRNVKGGAAK